ncbi:MAG: hypothetical protein DRH93_05190 [Deltaproteobacteria bacterium]|nr:MAG: hypothetical protein DRH93_05190 [Deltaproteobacteria bacterium]
MSMFDVIIIGAGPAGTAAAFDLLGKGLKVLILDKTQFPREKACAGGLTPKAYHLFKYDISPVIKKECRTIRINSFHNEPFLIRNENPICYMTKRADLDFFSLKKVIKKGAQFKVVKKIQSIDETDSYVEVQIGSAGFRASYLIGADGANSVVRRFVSKTRFYEKQFALEADVKIDRPDRVQMEFDFSKSRKGYYWIFPKDDHVNIGIYSTDANVRPKTRQLFEYAEARLQSRRLTAIKGYPICTGGFNYRPDSKRILFAGDAAGLSERLLGEGIYFAVKSGQIAAKSILESEYQKVSAGKLYLKQLKEIQTDLRFYHLSSNCLYKLPWMSLKALSFPFVHKWFAKGYADAKTLSQILYCQ